jgi:hypothetical protein
MRDADGSMKPSESAEKQLLAMDHEILGINGSRLVSEWPTTR